MLIVIVARSMLLFNYTLAIPLYVTRYNDSLYRSFVSTGVVIKSSNVALVHDYK